MIKALQVVGAHFAQKSFEVEQSSEDNYQKNNVQK
jgi:hypothetical protein